MFLKGVVSAIHPVVIFTISAFEDMITQFFFEVSQNKLLTYL